MMQLIPFNLQVIIYTGLCEKGLGGYVGGAVGPGISSSFWLTVGTQLGVGVSAFAAPLQTVPSLSLQLPGSSHLPGH